MKQDYQEGLIQGKLHINEIRAMTLDIAKAEF